MSVPQHGHNANTATASEVSQAARYYALTLHGSMSKEQRERHTAPARKAFIDKFLEQTKTPECPEGDPVQAEILRRAHYVGMALRSAEVRRRNKAARENGAA
jgi:hypothetical protein